MSMSVRGPAAERLRGIGSMVAAVFIFSIMDALLKRLSGHYGPFQVSCLRCYASLVPMTLVVGVRRSWSQLRLRSPALHLWRALFGITMLAGFVYAVHRMSLAETYAMFLCAPLLMTLLSVPLQGERVPPRRWAAILLGLCGVLLILRPSGRGFGALAAGAAAAAALSYALSGLTVRALGRTNSNASMVFWWLVLVGTGCGLLALGDWRPLDRGDWPWLAAVGVSGALGQYWVTDAFRRAPPSVVGPFEYTSILWAFGIDWLFWSASPSPRLLCGAGIVIAGGIGIVWDEHRLAQLAMTPASPPP
jgi:drug/metabolite transporter (DMT)-like permease